MSAAEMMSWGRDEISHILVIITMPFANTRAHEETSCTQLAIRATASNILAQPSIME